MRRSFNIFFKLKKSQFSGRMSVLTTQLSNIYVKVTRVINFNINFFTVLLFLRIRQT